MKAHNKIKSGVWLIVETVLVFVLGWFLADPEIMKLYRSMFIPMGWDYENVVVVPVEVLPDYDPDYDDGGFPAYGGGPVLGQRGGVCRAVPSVFPRH